MNLSDHWMLGLTGIVLFFLVRRWFDFRARVRAVGPDLPGFRLLLHTMVPLPWARLKGISVSRPWDWERRFENYKTFGCDIYSSVAAFPYPFVSVHIADPAVVREITLSRPRFPKPVKFYHLFSVFGPNILASEFEQHKRFRKSVAPAFSERNNKAVWDESIKVVEELFETPQWKDKTMIEFEHVAELTLQIALFVISAAGFGRQVSWEDNEKVPAGHTMTYKEAVFTSISNLLIKFLVPHWATFLNPKWRRVSLAFDEFHLYMKEMVHQRRDRLEKGEHVDLFSGLVDADDGPAGRLTDEEIVGNIFIFLVAGHETTAHTLAFTFGLLALYQDEQEKLYQHIISVMGTAGDIPGYEEMNSFTYCMAVMYETLRLFPTVPGVGKYTAEDTVVTTTATRPDGTHYPKQVFIAANTPIEISVTGMHYNPRYWPNPHEFRPSRFLGDYPRDAFMPFSAGVRACIGRRFAETEYVAILVRILSRYKVSVKDKPEWVGLSVEDKRERLMKAAPDLSLTPKQIPIRFTRR